MVPSILYVDDRIGSREFANPLKTNHHLKVRVARLQFGDFAFVGNGPSGPINVAVERKTLGDLIGSLMKNRLTGHQVPGLLKEYAISWVLVEGIFRPASDDAIEVFRGRGWTQARGSLTYSQLEAWMLSLEVMGGGRIKRARTSTVAESAHWVATLFRWWQKPWKKHTSMKSMTKWGPSLHGVASKALLNKPSDLMRVAAALPEVGGITARRLGRHFGSILEMMNASEDEWASVVGKADAATIYTTIRKRRTL